MLLSIEQRLFLRGEEVAGSSTQQLIQRKGKLIDLGLEFAPISNLGDTVVLNLHDAISQLLYANLEQEALHVIDRVLVNYVTVGVFVFDEFVDVAPPNVSMTFWILAPAFLSRVAFSESKK
jgi:hypothetical protein